MHKIFAKTVFLGKRVYFLPECHSTIDELSNLIKTETVEEGTLIYTGHQTSGRGQRGNQWIDEPGKNILLSLLLKPQKVAPSHQFYLNLIIGLAITNYLKELLPSESIMLKWPNDVYVGSKKVAGILIENNLRGALLETSIVGVGVNLNQSEALLDSATSVIRYSKKNIDREEFIENLLLHIEHWYAKLCNVSYEEIIDAYYEVMYWKEEIHTFRNGKTEFQGIIKGIDSSGRLIVLTSLGEEIYDVKEIQFVE